LRTILKQAGLSWKKCKKRFRKANAAKRAAFVAEFQQVYEQMCQGQVRIIYLDESHFHQDLDLGYTWTPTGQPAWRESFSPPLSARLNWYGAYDFSQGRCLIWEDGPCNTTNTLKFLKHLADWLGHDDRPTVIIWDGAPWHRAKKVRRWAAHLGFQLMPWPAYRPDLNPIEGLWHGMRQEVTQLFCHPSLTALADDSLAFIDQINLDPNALITRLWPKFDLDPAYEKLLVSN
jgi:transposase